jgi:hypothetical protein
MDDDAILPSIKKRISHIKKSKGDKENFDRKIYLRLADAVKKCPSDADINHLAIDRAQLSFPWEEGVEPFTSTVDARRILFTENELKK